jgi:twitching motility two-component system response regulator PilG
MEKIDPISEKKLTGFMHGFTLPNFLQYVEMEEKTCTLRIVSKGRSGYLYFQKGDLINAELNGFKGQEAVIKILHLEDAEIEVQDVNPQCNREIHCSLSALLLEAARIKDEKDSAPDEEKDLAQAIQTVESQRFQEAVTLLARFLKTYPKNYQGWLWYSRCTGSLNTIEAALNNASQIAPDNPEVREEIKKLQHAKKSVGEGRVRRCPFCWSPLDRKAFQCQFCRAHLIISKEPVKPSMRDINKKILTEAVIRFTKVRVTEKNVNALYYLGIAHYNLNHYEETLDLLNKAVKLVPEKKIFSDQLNILLSYMASMAKVHENDSSSPRRDLNLSASKKAVDNDKKVLVVEDSPTTRKVIALTLNQKGYAVIEAQDGMEALSKLGEEKPDLVLLDIILPKMDGYKILSIIKENEEFKNTPVIMLTSKDGILNKVKGKLAGSAAYLTKPFEPKDLIKTVEKYL